ncbi:MAG: glycoside hydrolase family 57 [Acidobacteriota bacterium]
MNRLQLYSIFHLNLAYSSIEEEQWGELIERCYQPLLELSRNSNLPIGIEASGYTLETISDLWPQWIEELRRLLDEKVCEFLGSGYAQLIGPLVPSEINAANLRLGLKVYQQLLGRSPSIALVNEQAYSAGLVGHYLEAGFEAIVMEWDNAARLRPEWEPEWRYLPQLACGPRGQVIPLIWNQSIAFQKFQRYAHGEIDLGDYLGYLAGHGSRAPRAFPVYCGDAEIFDFRPRRYGTEAALQKEGEWRRLEQLFQQLCGDTRFRLVKPAQVLDLMGETGAGHRIRLESAAQPIPVKKQEKYNITRWAVTGRDDLSINTRCWRLFESLRKGATTDEDWRRLCYLWSSDFRTHITRKRWNRYREGLARLESEAGLIHPRVTVPSPPIPSAGPGVGTDRRRSMPDSRVKREGRFLMIETPQVRLRLNCLRGLAIDALWFGPDWREPLCRTLPHGYYDDIGLGSDWYCGHTVLEPLGRPKVTDLSEVDPDWTFEVDGVRVAAVIPTPLGAIHKQIRVHSKLPLLEWRCRLAWKTIPRGSLRLGHITLNPAAFDRDRLFYQTHNGGQDLERFLLDGRPVDHGSPVSFLVSASQALGITGGVIDLGDAHRHLRIEVDKSWAALVGMITFRESGADYFCRLSFSMAEVDETLDSSPKKLTSPACRLLLKPGTGGASKSPPPAASKAGSFGQPGQPPARG